jgi:hypothetical protein
MIILKDTVQNEVAQFGHHLFYQNDKNLKSFEEVAQLSVRSIFETFRESDGQSTFALARIYRYCQTEELPSDIIESLGLNAGSDGDWLALMGTVGDEPAWCDRQFSQHHQAVCINDNMSMMFKAVLNQLRLMPEQFEDDIPVTVGESSLSIVKYFYVPDAYSNTSIPDKDDFVIPYGIRSVIGIGSPLLSGAFYTGLFFSKVSLSSGDVEAFIKLSPAISTLLSSYDRHHPLWN